MLGRKKGVVLGAALVIASAGVTAACSPPSYGPGSAGYRCFDVHRTIWLAERPVPTRIASMTVGSTICTQDTVTLYSSTPYVDFNKMGALQAITNDGKDYAKTIYETSTSTEFEGGAHSQLCLATKYLPACSFMDHVHFRIGYTTPTHVGPNGVVSITTDRGDISVYYGP